MSDRKSRFRGHLDLIALVIATASLGWQVFDAIEKQREHVSGEVTLIRQPTPGKIDIVFTVRNPGSRGIFVESCELRAYSEKGKGPWKTVQWSSAPKQNAIDPGQSLTATVSVESIDQLREFFQQAKCLCFSFQSQGGASVNLWMEQDLKEKIYVALSFQQPSVTLKYRAL